MRLVDQPAPQPGEEMRASYNVASPGYFAVMGVQPLHGRLLDERDGPTAPRVVVISEAFAERYLRDIDPDRPAPRDSRAGQAGADGNRRRRAARCATSGSIRRPRRSVPALCAIADRLDDAGGAHQRRPGNADRDRQARDLDDRSAADVLSHRHARGAGRSHADHPPVRADRPDRIRGAGAAAGGGRPLRRAEHDRLAIPQGDRRAHGARRRVARHPAPGRDARAGRVGDRRRRSAWSA